MVNFLPGIMAAKRKPLGLAHQIFNLERKARNKYYRSASIKTPAPTFFFGTCRPEKPSSPSMDMITIERCSHGTARFGLMHRGRSAGVAGRETTCLVHPVER
jgi:hypothetical protein